MVDDYQDYTPPKRRSFRIYVVIITVGILAGGALTGWGLSRWSGARDYLFGRAVATAGKTPAAIAQPVILTAPLPAPQTGTISEARIAELESRISQLGRNTLAQNDNSSRAEGLLLAFAARRALDRGIALGYIEGQLTQYFGTTQPRAVSMIIAAARAPVTLDQLKISLAALSPQLIGAGPDESWWNQFKRSFSGLIIVRQQDTPSPDPAERLARAKLAIELGRVDQALAEVARLPNRDIAANWMATARRHIEAYRALDLIEAAAIIGPGRITAPPVITLPQSQPPSEPATNGQSEGTF